MAIDLPSLHFHLHFLGKQNQLPEYYAVYTEFKEKTNFVH